MARPDRTGRHIRILWAFCSKHMPAGKVEMAIPGYKDMSQGELCRELWKLCEEICQETGLKNIKPGL